MHDGNDVINVTPETDKKQPEKKQKQPKQIRATLAICLAIFTLFASLLGATLISKSVAASETQEVVTTEVEYKIQQVMDSPPVQEMLEASAVDEEALRQEIIDTVTADVLSKAMRQWQSLSASDMKALEQELYEIISNSLHNSVSNFNSEELINTINEELNIEGDTTMIDEEWLTTLITSTVTTLIEQTLVDVLSQQMEIIDGDLQTIQNYIDKNLDVIYQLIADNAVEIENLKIDISNLQEQINKCATQEQLFQVTTNLESMYTEFTTKMSNVQVQISFLEATLAEYNKNLTEQINKNTTDITNLSNAFNAHVVESTNQINILNNKMLELMENSAVAYNETLEQEINNLTQLIEQNNAEFNKKLEENMKVINQRIDELEQNFANEIQLVKNDINNKIDDNRHKTEQNITYVDNKITEDLDETDNRLTDQLNETAHNIYDDMNQMDDRLTNELNETGNNLIEDINNMDDRLTNELNETGHKVANEMNELDEAINVSIDSLAYNIYTDVNKLDTDIIAAFKTFNDNSFKNFSTLHAYTKSVEECLNYNVQNIEKITNSNTVKTETWIEQLDARQQKNLTTVANQLNTNIGTMSTYIKSEVDTAINTLNANITNEIGAKFSSFASSTATAVNNLGTSVENVFKGMGSVVKVDSFNPSTGVLYLSSTKYDGGAWGTVTKPSLTAPTINMATVTLGQMGALPSIEVKNGQVYVNGVKATSNSVTDPTLDKIQYQDKVVDPTTGSYINSSKDASNPQYDTSVTNPEDRDYQHQNYQTDPQSREDYVTDPKDHTDYIDGTYNTITWDEQGNINGEVETFGTTP